MKSGDWHNFLRASLVIVLGLAALIVAPFQGSLEIAALGVLALLLGSALLAFLIWDIRNPVRPTPMRLGRRRYPGSK